MTHFCLMIGGAVLPKQYSLLLMKLKDKMFSSLQFHSTRVAQKLRTKKWSNSFLFLSKGTSDGSK